MEKIRFDRKTWRRLRTLAKPFFFGEKRWQARGFLALLAVFSISVSMLNVFMSYVNRDFMTALSLKEKDEFIRNLYRYILAFAGVVPVVVFYRYTEERFGMFWRRWLSLRILRRYFSNRAYYKINAYEGIDNPDQRIEEDIRTFCNSSLSITLIFFNSLITIFAFTPILWSISIWLVIAVVLYAICGSLISYMLGRPLISLNFAQLKREADYRYKLVNVRDNAESIAFFKGERKEYTRTRQRLKEALRNLLQIINWNRNLNFFTNTYNYIIGILPTVIVAPLYLSGQIEFGVVIQAGTAFVQVVNALSIIPLNFGQFSTIAAVVTRLGTFWEALETVSAEEHLHDRGINTVEADKIALQRVTICTPKYDQTLIRDLDFDIDSKSLLITGPSGSGKSSILRAIAGLWTAGSGTIYRPPLAKGIFLPQRPYMILGAFRSQLVYGQRQSGLSDRVLLEMLKKVGLEDTYKRVGGFGASLDWPNFLSTGEQQRLAFARLALFAPKYAFLDEATTALNHTAEAALYEMLRQYTQSFVSVGYRATLAEYHDYILELQLDGTWKFEATRGK